MAFVIQQWFKERNPQLMANASVFSNGKIAASGGSHPVFHGNEMIGAYAISGATSGQDEEIAEYARKKVGWEKAASDDDVVDGVKKHINDIYSKVGLGDRKL